MTKLDAIKRKASIEAGDERRGRVRRRLDRVEEDEGLCKNRIEIIGLNKLVHLQEKLITKDMVLNHDPNIISTNGLYSISYQSPNSPKYKKGRPYLIGQDLVRGCFCFAGPGHLRDTAKKIPEFAWLLKWTNFDFGLFDVARCHCGVTFRFTVDWVRYAKQVLDNAKKDGIDTTKLENSVFFVHLSSKKTEEEKDLTVLKKTIYDYQEELKDADAEQND